MVHASVWVMVGKLLGAGDGSLLGLAEGLAVGALDGPGEGLFVFVGAVVGLAEGLAVGNLVGSDSGLFVSVGTDVGLAESGAFVGFTVGAAVAATGIKSHVILRTMLLPISLMYTAFSKATMDSIP